MANNIIKRVWNQNRMVNIEALSGMAFQAESGGHTFEISGIDADGNAVPLSGTVAGVFLRPDNADIALIGAASDGKVSVTLTEDCYAIPGKFGLTVFVTSDEQKVAVYAAIGTVSQTSGGGVAGDTPQDVVDLINAIAAAVATIPADYTDLMAAIAPTYSSSALYAVGSYAWYDGELYRCTTAITTAETWTAAHWTLASLGNNVAGLKSAFNAFVRALDASDFTFEIGKTVASNGLIVDQPGMALSSVIDIANIKGIFNLTNGIGYNGKETVMMIAEYKNTTFYQRTYANSNSIYEFSDGVTNIRIIYGYPVSQNVNMTSELLNQYFSCAMIVKNIDASNFDENVTAELEQKKVLTKTNLLKANEKKGYYETEFTAEKCIVDDGRIIDVTGLSNYTVSDYIEIGDAKKIYVSGSADFHNGVCAFYDSSKNVVSVPLIAASSSTKTYFTDEPVDVPNDAVYVVIASASTKAPATVYYISGYNIAKWAGLKWCCVGDSLTEKNSRTSINYADYISQDTGISIVNLGLSGSGYKRKYDTNGAFYQRISSVPTDCDVVTIFGSGNDQEYFAAATMGTATDTGTETLGGCINTTIDNLYAIMPTVQLGIIAPTPWSDYNPVNTNNGMSRYTELLKTICANRSIPFLDLYHSSNLRPWDSSFLPYAYSKDGGNGVHPDETGHKLFAGRIREFVSSLLGTIDN